MPRKKKTAEEAVSKILDIQDIFSTPKGEEVLYHLCKVFHYFQSSYNGNVNDCLFREGERNVINYIMANMQKDAGIILKEYRSRLKKEEQDNYED